MCAWPPAGADAEQQVREAEAIVRELLGPHIYGVEDEDLETVIVRLLTERKATLALAESCTGGCIAQSGDECARRLGGPARGTGHLQQRRQAEIPRRPGRTLWPSTAR